MDVTPATIVMTPEQLNELLESRLNTCAKDAVPQMVKGMVQSLTSGLTDQVNALTEAHGRSDRKIDKLASNVSAITERMKAQEAKRSEHDQKMEQQIEMPMKAVEDLRTSPPAAAATAPPRRSRAAHRTGRAPRLPRQANRWFCLNSKTRTSGTT